MGRMSPFAAMTVIAAFVVGLFAVTLSPAVAAEPTELTITGPAVREGNMVAVTVTLVSAGAPVATAPVVLERKQSGEWTTLAQLTTDASGFATSQVQVSRDPADNRFRAVYDGDALHDPAQAELQVKLIRRSSRVRLSGPGKVVDETEARLRARWTAGGRPVAGTVELQRKKHDRWRTVATASTDARGSVDFVVAPREDSRWRVVVRRIAWASAAHSSVHRLDNRPPGDPVQLPRRAPRPRIELPVQTHAVGDGDGDGANAKITRIPKKVWRTMIGRSWHRGCPVGRSGLRLLRINYWDYEGYRRRGELVAATGAIETMASALKAMYRRKFPIRAMYRVDRFGWSKRVQGANDYAAMAAGNTSAFNCRNVVGRPGVRSPHATGRHLDINTWENPFRSEQGLYPNAWWQAHWAPRIAWRSRAHPVVRLMARHGIRWTYGLSDTQHFNVPVGRGRMLLDPACIDIVCE